VPWSRATPDTCYANSRRERGGMPEPLQVLANLSHAWHVQQRGVHQPVDWCTPWPTESLDSSISLIAIDVTQGEAHGPVCL
jgi:hypothetical protein